MLGGGGEVEEDILVLDLGTTGADMDLGMKQGRGNEVGHEGCRSGEDFGKIQKSCCPKRLI